MKRIKVLQCINSLGIGGNSIFVMNYFRKIDKEYFQVDFLIFDDTKLDFYQEVRDAGSEVFLCISKCKNKFTRLYDQMKKVRKILKNNHYDIIHCHSCSFAGIFRGAVPGYFTKGTKVIAHSHNPGMPSGTLIDRIVRNCAKFILSHIIDMGFSCSDIAGASKYTNRFMHSSRYNVIENAVAIEKFYFNPEIRNRLRKQFRVEDRFVIGSVGRLEKEKNYLYLIDVFAEYLSKYKASALLLVGDGSQREEIEKSAREKGILENVIIVGKTGQPENYYQMMDVFVLPSVFEGFGLVNIEAQVSGLSCIVSEAVPREVDISEEVYFLKISGDKSEWLGQLSVIKKKWEQGIERKTVLTEKYSISHACGRLESFYKMLVL